MAAARWTVTAWDARILGRALALGALALLVAWLVTAATDEGGIAWGVRAGRTLPATPLCAAVATWIALAPARARGEVVALAALGRAPWQIALGAAAGGAAVALAAALAMAASPVIDVSGFYPVARHATEYRYDGSGFVDDEHGWRVAADGEVTRVPDVGGGAPKGGVPPRGRAAAALATGLAGAALPVLGGAALLATPAHAGRRRRRFGPGSVGRALFFAVTSAGAAVFLFHAAAAGRLSALWATLPSAALLVVAVASLLQGAGGRGVVRA